MNKLVRLSAELRDQTERLRFRAPVAHVYNPLIYAWGPHVAYLERYGQEPKEALLLGMNPGPFGMAQTGVPFGDVAMVKGWLGVQGAVRRPAREHPKRRIEGFACTRSEVSGTRLWGWARDRFATPQRFFERFFVINYCPLVFMEASSRNLTPDKLPAREQQALFAACDEALAGAIAVLRPRFVIGVGLFAQKRAQQVVASLPSDKSHSITVGSMLHPSPASPKANRGWAEAAEADLAKLGIKL